MKKGIFLSGLGVDDILTIKFNQEFAKQEADPFMRSLHKHLQFSCLLIGYDFRFGADRSGSLQTLKKLGEELGFCVKTIDPFEKDSQAISSSTIRSFIS